MNIEQEVKKTDSDYALKDKELQSEVDERSTQTVDRKLVDRGYMWHTLSRLISTLLHPFMVPTYLMLLLFYGNTIVAFAQPRLKFFFIATVILNTSIIPALFTSLLHSSGFLRYFSLEERYKRMLPIAVTAVCYGICAYIIPHSFFVIVLKRFLIAGTVCVVFALIMSWKWKISLHMIAMGAFLAMVLALEVSGVGRMILSFIIFTLLTGILASARLYLGQNNLAQLGVGFLGGFLTAALIIL